MSFQVGDIVKYLKGYDYVIAEVLGNDKYIIKFAKPFSRSGQKWSKEVTSTYISKVK